MGGSEGRKGRVVREGGEREGNMELREGKRREDKGGKEREEKKRKGKGEGGGGETVGKRRW